MAPSSGEAPPARASPVRVTRVRAPRRLTASARQASRPRRRACARARRASSPSTGATSASLVSPGVFTTRKWRSARAATCGRWVTQSSCGRAELASFSPSPRAVRPPMPASTSSKTSIGAPPRSVPPGAPRARCARARRRRRRCDRRGGTPGWPAEEADVVAPRARPRSASGARRGAPSIPRSARCHSTVARGSAAAARRLAKRRGRLLGSGRARRPRPRRPQLLVGAPASVEGAPAPPRGRPSSARVDGAVAPRRSSSRSSRSSTRSRRRGPPRAPAGSGGARCRPPGGARSPSRTSSGAASRPGRAPPRARARARRRPLATRRRRRRRGSAPGGPGRGGDQARRRYAAGRARSRSAASSPASRATPSARRRAPGARPDALASAAAELLRRVELAAGCDEAALPRPRRPQSADGILAARSVEQGELDRRRAEPPGLVLRDDR